MGEINKMNSNLFMRSETCPICGEVTKQPHYKVRTYVLLNTEYDLYSHYKGINPLYYGAKLCNKCGYANLTNVFDKPSKVLKLCRNSSNLFNENWKPWVIPEENNINYAIQLHKLVLMNYVNQNNVLVGELGYICLKLYWLNKEAENSAEMIRFRRLALKNLKECYSTQVFPICNILDKDTTVYIIAILSFYEDEVEECKRWLSLLIQNNLISIKLRKRIVDFKMDFLKNNDQ